MLALSVRQPFAELILRGIKRCEYRSRATRVVGERFHLYASLKWATVAGAGAGVSADGRGKVWSRDLSMPGGDAPPWMWELAEGLRLFGPGGTGGEERNVGGLPTGVIVGSAMIEKVTRVGNAGGVDGADAMYAWHLANVRRASRLVKPTGRPQPAWFRAFGKEQA